MSDLAAFQDFYRAVNGRDPLPWQSRLADLVVSQGWPKEVGVPTGMGKTSCLDIAVWALARSADNSTGRLPTRVWYVVNRRLLVDAAWEHAKHLRDLLAEPRSAEEGRTAVASVRERLASLTALGTGDGSPLFVTRLRGGAELGARPPDPSQPSLLLATVPMFASRWLFRGYGSSASMRPVDAAHAGIDSLVLLDEAHLARPLLELVGTVASCDTGDPREVLPPERSRPVLVAMTATGEVESASFTLDEADIVNPVVSQRLYARKRGQLVETTKGALAKELASQALAALRGQKEACIVFTNTPVTAREVAVCLSSGDRREDEPEVLLVTGRTREREADQLRERLLNPGLGVPAGKERNFDRPLVVIATQTLEVGADIDFDHLVTETAGARSLVQRLGRVNRLGERPWATATICHPADLQTWPVYKAEPAQVWLSLKREARAGADLDLSPSNVSRALGPPADTPDRVGALLPAHLWEWAKTTTPPQGEAPVELFFEGFDTDDSEVSVVWRAHRPIGVRLLPAVSEAEAVDIPIGEVRQVLKGRQVARLADDKASLEEVGADELRPGDVVVLAPEDGLYDRHGWNSTSRETVLDVSPLRFGALPLDAAVLENLAPGSAEKVAPLLSALTTTLDDDGQEVDEHGEVELLDELVEHLRGFTPHPWLSEAEWARFLDGLSRTLTRPVGPGVDQVPQVEPATRQRRWEKVDICSEAFEELSSTASSQLLRDHLQAVGETAALFARCLGLHKTLVDSVRLAGEWHDLGKYDPRFQRWMSPDGPTPEALAKSGQPRALWGSSQALSGWPKGGRHELLSTRLAASWLQQHPVDCDTDLVLHLVTSHHGEGRPFVKVVRDNAPVSVVAPLDTEPVCVSGDLGLPDWEQPRRFRRVCERYGLWGVALLEAILRQADHAVSHVAGVA